MSKSPKPSSSQILRRRLGWCGVGEDIAAQMDLLLDKASASFVRDVNRSVRIDIEITLANPVFDLDLFLGISRRE